MGIRYLIIRITSKGSLKCFIYGWEVSLTTQVLSSWKYAFFFFLNIRNKIIVPFCFFGKEILIWKKKRGLNWWEIGKNLKIKKIIKELKKTEHWTWEKTQKKPRNTRKPRKRRRLKKFTKEQENAQGPKRCPIQGSKWNPEKFSEKTEKINTQECLKKCKRETE